MTLGKLWGTWNWLEKGLFALTVSLAISALGVIIVIALAWLGGREFQFKLGPATITVDFEDDDDNGDENGDENGEDENGDEPDPDGVHGGDAGGGQLPFDQSLVDLGVIQARRQAFGLSALQEAGKR